MLEPALVSQCLSLCSSDKFVRGRSPEWAHTPRGPKKQKSPQQSPLRTGVGPVQLTGFIAKNAQASLLLLSSLLTKYLASPFLPPLSLPMPLLAVPPANAPPPPRPAPRPRDFILDHLVQIGQVYRPAP
ncbi:hypothetical protein IF1G_00662 [Cordyceps javanica]|uniref:Uncharacterized protein n=1 Tax=Cordyceps javanica TaxID=43265 RepID=A0A545VG98_9HYPO|nr:hypothetical protein IF1G_00662 [Cordyceps javanica]